MLDSAETPAVALLRTVLERVLRTRCLGLESLRLQTQGCLLAASAAPLPPTESNVSAR